MLLGSVSTPVRPIALVQRHSSRHPDSQLNSHSDLHSTPLRLFVFTRVRMHMANSHDERMQPEERDSATATPDAQSSPSPLVSRFSSNNPTTLHSLATVELQLILQFLGWCDLLSFGLSCRSVLHAASAPFAWRFAHVRVHGRRLPHLFVGRMLSHIRLLRAFNELDAAGARAVGGLKHLTTLHMQALATPPLVRAMLAHSAPLPSLHTLHLQGSQLDSSSLRALSPLSSLRHLSLLSPERLPSGALRELRHLKSLRALAFQCGSYPPDSDTLEGILSPPNLHKLHLGLDPLYRSMVGGSETARAFLSHPALKRLSALSLHNLDLDLLSEVELRRALGVGFDSSAESASTAESQQQGEEEDSDVEVVGPTPPHWQLLSLSHVSLGNGWGDSIALMPSLRALHLHSPPKLSSLHPNSLLAPDCGVRTLLVTELHPRRHSEWIVHASHWSETFAAHDKTMLIDTRREQDAYASSSPSPLSPQQLQAIAREGDKSDFMRWQAE